MRQVTKDEFFAVMGPQNVMPSIKTGWPYTSDWELPNREVLGRSVIRIERGIQETDWFVKEKT